MSETLKRLFIGTSVDPLVSKGELVVIPTSKSLPDLSADIRRLNSEVENALLSAVAYGIEAGKSLTPRKGDRYD